jgi:hypothetical protein
VKPPLAQARDFHALTARLAIVPPRRFAALWALDTGKTASAAPSPLPRRCPMVTSALKQKSSSGKLFFRRPFNICANNHLGGAGHRIVCQMKPGSNSPT